MLPLWWYTFFTISNVYYKILHLSFPDSVILNCFLGQQFKTEYICEYMCLDSCLLEAEVNKGCCWYPYTTHNLWGMWELHMSTQWNDENSYLKHHHRETLQRRMVQYWWYCFPICSLIFKIKLWVSGIDVRVTAYFLHNLSFHLSK